MPSASNYLRGWAKKSLSGLVLLVSMAASYVGLSILQPRPKGAASHVISVNKSGGARVNPFASVDGTNLIAFVVTASDCAWSKQPAGMEAIRSVGAKLRAVHGGSYAQVSVIGVALDRDLDTGLQFLSHLGKGRPGALFDQLFVGGSWLNEQIVRFVWREHVTKASIPQVLVIERHVSTKAYLVTFAIAVQDDRVVANPTGVAELITWIKRGVPLNRPHAGLLGDRPK